MINSLLESTIGLFTFLAFYYLFLEREKMHQFNRFYLLFSLVISFIIPFLNFEIIEIKTVIENIEPISIRKVTSVINENVVENDSIPQKETINYFPSVIWCLYSLVTFLFLFRFVKNTWKLISKSKSNPIIKYKNARLILIHEKTLPHTFLNFIFINFEDYNSRKIEDELYTHELVHVTEKHTLDILFIEFLKCIFWFNPIFYFYKKAIQLNHEFLAVEKVVHSYNNVTFYQNLLLQKSSNVQTIYLASNLNYLVTKKRLIMMTKSTSKKLALVKKVTIIPIVAALVYFFCIDIVAQEKIVNVKSEIKKDNPTDKDKIRDSYYSGVYVKILDEKSNRRSVTVYEDLSLKDKRKYLDYIPEIHVEKEIPELLFKRLKTKNWKIGIDNKLINKEELKNYKRTDFSYYSYSNVDKSERTEKFPLAYQYTLYTKEYFNKNIKNSHVHFKGDTIKIVYASYKTAMKNIVVKRSKADSIVWYTKEKEGYNLYVNDSVKSSTDFPYKDLDAYYGNTRVIIKNKDGKIILDKPYNELSLEQKKRVPPPAPAPEKLKMTVKQFVAYQKKSEYAVWIDGKHVENSELKNYTAADFVLHLNSHVYKNARSEKFPQENQASLYTEEGYKELFEKKDKRFGGTIEIREPTVKRK
jgi:beta-lactamase regulating signal transducer with metallopeptidase domain